MRGALFLFAAFAIGCGTSASNANPVDAGSDATAEAGGLCVGGQSVDGPYPKRDYTIALHGTLPDLTFDTVASDGISAAKVSLHEFFEPCAPQSRLLVLRIGAAWCGTCRWHDAHTGDLKKLDVGARLEFLDFEIHNEDGIPPTPFDLGRYRKLIDAPDRVAADPKARLLAVNPTTAPLPLYVFVDTRTMTVKDFSTNPEPGLLELRIRQALADLDGTPAPPPTASPKIDGYFFKNEWDMLHDMTLPGAPPPDTTNAHADDSAAAALGKQLFSDATLSPSGTVSCATCHVPAKQFNDGLPVSEGLGHTDRNAPAIALAAHQRWQFWDGRADTLWSQALGPLENAREFGASRLFVAHAIFDRYAAAYTPIFGPLPPLGDTTRFPSSGMPGVPAYDKMKAGDQQAATRVFANAGKAIAAYERTLRVKPNRLDVYVGGDVHALSPQEKNGLAVFFTLGCAQCHWGPRLTDDAFHATRFPTGRTDGKADVGRQDGQALLIQSEFIAAGIYSDDKSTAHSVAFTGDPVITGAFKTPTLRGIPGSAPYGHGGQLQTLDAVVALYSQGGLPASDPHAIGIAPPWIVTYDHNARDALLPFLSLLTGEVEP